MLMPYGAKCYSWLRDAGYPRSSGLDIHECDAPVAQPPSDSVANALKPVALRAVLPGVASDVGNGAELVDGPPAAFF
jgi:hypothetical protein